MTTATIDNSISNKFQGKTIYIKSETDRVKKIISSSNTEHQSSHHNYYGSQENQIGYQQQNECSNESVSQLIIFSIKHHLTTCQIFSPPIQLSKVPGIHNSLKVPFRKTNVGQNALLYSGPNLWNKIPINIKVSAFES